MKKNIPFVLFLLLITSLATAQLANWTPGLNTTYTNFPVNVSGQINGSCRIVQMKFHATDPTKLYAVTAEGGFFTSTNTGTNWSAKAGTENLTGSCASLCIDYTNDQVIYLGSGDPSYYSNGSGVYKSTNGGATFTATTLTNCLVVEILQDPNNAGTFVAATNKGIYKSTNNGSTWTAVTATNIQFCDLKQNAAANSSILYACTRENSSRLYRSTDFGGTWTQITSGITTSATFIQAGARIGVTPADPNVVYFEAIGGGGIIHKSTDGGLTFTVNKGEGTGTLANPYLTFYDYNNANGLNGQGNYNNCITVDATDPAKIWLQAHNTWLSTDSGVTWTEITHWSTKVHTDMHQVQQSPFDSSKLYSCNDGGIWLSTDGGNNWVTKSDGLYAYEIYNNCGRASNTDKNAVSIGTQDNGRLYRTATGWFTDRGGDDTRQKEYDYLPNGGNYYEKTQTNRKAANGGASSASGFPTAGGNYWEFLAFNRSNVNLGFMWFTDNNLYRTTNLSAATPTWTSVFTFSAAVMAMHSSIADPNRLYVITTDTKIHVSSNALSATPTFTTITLPSASNSLASITAIANDANKVYIAINNRVYSSSDAGATWTNITYNLPNVNHRKIVAEEFGGTQELVFIATNNAVYYKKAGQVTWTNYSTNLPGRRAPTNFTIYDDGTYQSVIRYYTYGRGVWETPFTNLRALNAQIFVNAESNPDCNSHVVTYGDVSGGVPSSYSWTFTGGTPATSSSPTPTVTYTVNGTYDVTLTITDANGNSSTQTISKNIQLLPKISSAVAIVSSPVSSSFCLGGSVTLTASGGVAPTFVELGTGTSVTVGNQSISTLGPNPLQNWYGGSKQLMLFTVEELNALGLIPGSRLSGFAVNIVAANTGYVLQNLQVKMQNTTLNSLSTFVTSGWTVVRNSGNYTLSGTGWNTIPFTSNYTWNGTSNILIEINYSNNNNGSSGNTALYGPTSNVSTLFYRVDGVAAATVDAYSGAPTHSYSARNNVRFSIVNTPVTYTWSPATGLNTTTGTTVIATPAATTTYTVTANTDGTCPVEASKIVTLTSYPITASAGSDGSISPTGVTNVNCGANQTYSITPNACYKIADVLVDGVSQGAIATYTFNNVTVAHTISATFIPNTYTLTASAGSNGSITPNGVTTVCSGASQSYTIAANSGYHIMDVLVNGSSVGAVSTYNFTNVTSNQTISATFAPNCTVPSLSTTQTNISCLNATGTATVNTTGGSSPFTYLWNDSLAQTTATATGLAAGTYTVVVTATGGCSANISVTITSDTTAPTVNASATPSSVCLGSSSVLSASGNADTYTWDPGSLSGASQTVIPATTTTYTVTGTNTINGCTTVKTVLLTVSPFVTPAFTPVGPICSGDSIAALPTTSNNGINGTWSPALNNTANTTYTFTPNSGQCSLTTNMHIVVNSNHLVSLGLNPSSICSGDSTMITATATNVTPTINFVDGGGTNQSLIMTPAVGGFPVASPLSGTLYDTGSKACNAFELVPMTGKIALIERGTCSFLVKVQNAQMMGAIGVIIYNSVEGDFSIVGTSSVAIPIYGVTRSTGLALKAAAVSNELAVTLKPSQDLVYLWSNGDTTPTINSGILNTNTNFSVTVTNPATGCSTVQNITVPVTPSIIPTFTAVAPICSGDSLAALPTTSNNGITGTWSPVLNNSVTTTYTFIPNSGQCVRTATMTIVVNSKPTVSLTLGSSQVCSGSGTTITATTTNNTSTIHFVDGGGNFQSSVMTPSGDGVLLTGPLSGVLYDTGSKACNSFELVPMTGKIALIERGTCTFFTKVQNAQMMGAIGVIIYNNVESNFSIVGVSSLSIPVYGVLRSTGLALKAAAVNSELAVTLNPPASLTYLWSNGDTTPSTNTGILNSNTDFSVTVTNAGTGCTTVQNISVPVTPTIIPTFTAVGPICSGDSLAALPTTSNNGITGTWSPALNNTATTTYIFTPNVGQCAPTTTVTITVVPMLNWYLDADADGYYTGTAVPTCTSPGAGYTTTVTGGGDCNDANATINPGVAEICYNNIDDNCSGSSSEGCSPVAVYMTQSYHNTTLASLATAIPAVAYTYPGTTNIKYRFSITNVTSGVTAPDIIQTSRYVTIPASLHLYGASYDIKVSAVINDEVLPFVVSGVNPINPIRVSGPTVQLVTLNAATCGATLATLASTLTANAGLNATGYTFRIRLNDSNPSPTYAYSQSATRFVSANSFTGFPLQYASSYKVAVQYTFNDPITNLPVQSGYGAECTVNTPSIPLISLASPACGSTVTALNANIAALSASYATGYQFRIRLFTDNGPTPAYYYSVPNSSRFSSLTAFQGISLAYNTAYSISVQYSVLNGASTVWSGYGSECKVTTPFFPTTSLVPSQCGLAIPTSLTQQLNITPYPGFPNYKVKLEEVSGEDVVNSQEIVVTYSYFRLNQFSIAQLGKNYNVSVAIKLNGVFGDYSTACDLFTAPLAKTNTTMPFKVTAYPNPFANNFVLDIATVSNSQVNIRVYDMLGRLIENKSCSLSEVETTTIGDRYPTGVYNVVVSQENSIETVRVLKR